MGGGVLLSNLVLCVSLTLTLTLTLSLSLSHLYLYLSLFSTFPYFIPGDSAAGRVGGQGGFSGGSKRLQQVRGSVSVGAREGG